MLKTFVLGLVFLTSASVGKVFAQDCTTFIYIGGVSTSPCVDNRLDIPVYMNNPCEVAGFQTQIYATDPDWLEFDPNDTLAADTIGSRNSNWGHFEFEVHSIFENRISVLAIGPGGQNLPPGDGLLFTLHINFNSRNVSDTCQLMTFGNTTVSDSLGGGLYPRILAPDSVCVSECDPGMVRGDANNNGQLNGLDVVYLVNYFKGGPSICLGCTCQGDANNSGSVNGLDVTFLVSFLKGGPSPDPCD